MTIDEVSARFQIGVSTLGDHFPRAQQKILKNYGLHLVKMGRGKNAVYEIQEERGDCRALTLYEEIKDDIAFDNTTLRMMNWPCLVILTLVTTPMLVFRGSYEDFLNYVQMNVTKENIEDLKQTLEDLMTEEFISYTIDKTNNNYFVAAIYRKKEEQMHIGIGMVRTCKKIADCNHKRHWIPLLKVWVGMQMMAEKQLFRVSDLVAATGMSEYQVREARKLLEQNEIFKTTKAYIDYQTCIGSTVDLNGFYN